MYVEYPVDTVGNGEPIFRRLPIEMINNRYGRIKTNETIVVQGKRATYRQCESWVTQIREGPLHTSDMWDFFVSSSTPLRDSDREESLYEVIDTATGYILTRADKHAAKRFIDFIVKEGFYFWGEEKRDIGVLHGSSSYGQYRTEHRLVGVYACGTKEFHTYRKLTATKE